MLDPGKILVARAGICPLGWSLSYCWDARQNPKITQTSLKLKIYTGEIRGIQNNGRQDKNVFIEENNG